MPRRASRAEEIAEGIVAMRSPPRRITGPRSAGALISDRTLINLNHGGVAPAPAVALEA